MAKSFFEDLVCGLLETATSDCAFGKPIVYESKTSAIRVALNAVHDSPFDQVDPDTQVVVASNELSIGIKLEDLKGLTPEKGDLVYQGSLKFRVIDSQEDGQGGAQIFLHKAC